MADEDEDEEEGEKCCLPGLTPHVTEAEEEVTKAAFQQRLSLLHIEPMQGMTSKWTPIGGAGS